MQTLNLLTHIIKYLIQWIWWVFFLPMQHIRLTTYYHSFVKQLMSDFCLFKSHLLSQNGNITVLLMLFVEELEVSFVDLMIANAVLLVTRSSVFMYAINIQNDVILLMLREICKSNKWPTIAWPSRCHDTIHLYATIYIVQEIFFTKWVIKSHNRLGQLCRIMFKSQWQTFRY